MGTAAEITNPPHNRTHFLSEQIRASTTSAHSQLNRLVIARLPLALPPQTTDASTYIFGLLHITLIYSTFESLWSSIIEPAQSSTSLANPRTFCAHERETHALQSQHTSINPNYSNNSVIQVDLADACTRTHDLLARFRLPTLLRSQRLRSDIRSVSGMSEHSLDEHLEKLGCSGEIAEVGQFQSKEIIPDMCLRHIKRSLVNSKLNFTAHIKRSVKASPHVLMAYAWVFYMALFSGGRFVRRAVQAAGPEFWEKPSNVHFDTDSSAESTSKDHVQFLIFIGNEDGEDIKLEFKKRFAEAETQLTDKERGEIIKESQIIFHYMIDIVKELHEATETGDLYRKRKQSGE